LRRVLLARSCAMGGKDLVAEVKGVDSRAGSVGGRTILGDRSLFFRPPFIHPVLCLLRRQEVLPRQFRPLHHPRAPGGCGQPFQERRSFATRLTSTSRSGRPEIFSPLGEDIFLIGKEMDQLVHFQERRKVSFVNFPRTRCSRSRRKGLRSSMPKWSRSASMRPCGARTACCAIGS
jgi:hypothetical protein